ncbi:hypothetical protein JVT61DRAFT_4637 [Boletus reticuloceps]|uniref:PIH1 N-terminal domain-containing protein n=1 Tax=Boletus reticuloceps TaxID=495285 RepID=A0A8I2YMU0_9AGAM|nr:hypothetical protein JVT61DRAFT_4637 [Boletus reticuloceps]
MQTTTPAKVSVALNPVPGFCVKSWATNDALVRLSAPGDSDIHVKKGLKIFINIAWDQNIPPPPPASDDAIQRAMQGLDVDESNPEAWFVPIVLSDARQDSDKGRHHMNSVHVVPLRYLSPMNIRRLTLSTAGRSAIVFDCGLHPFIKSRCLKDPDFKSFIIGIHPSIPFPFPTSPLTLELAFQRIETQTTLVLSRQIGMPNIASKGKPQSRRVLVSAALYPPGHPNHQSPPTLIQEIADQPTRVPQKTQPKTILKQSSTKTPNSQHRIPAWSCAQQGASIRIVFDVPGVVSKLSPLRCNQVTGVILTQARAVIPDSTLDVEPRRILIHIPALYDLDLNLDASDAELVSVFGKNDTSNEALKLKRMRNLDVDNARAEWRVADRTIVLLT